MTRSRHLATGLLALTVLLAIGGCAGPVEVPSGALLVARGAEVVVRAERGTEATEAPLIHLGAGASVLALAPSSDGTRLALAVQAQPGRLPSGELDFGSDLYVAARGGGDLRKILTHRRAEFLDTPGWLADGRLAFVSRSVAADGGPSHELQAIDLASGTRETLIRGATAAAVTPDGRGAVILRVNRAGVTEATESLVFVDLATGAERAIVPPDAGFVLVSSLEVSPDGTRLAFAAAGGAETVSRPARPARTSRPRLIRLGSTRHPTLQDLWVVSLDGSDLVRIAELAETRPTLTWRADGERVVSLGPGGLRETDVRARRSTLLGAGTPGVVRLVP